MTYIDQLNAAMRLDDLRVPPGNQLEISQVDLARQMGISYPRLNELIHGKRGVTPDTALRLERVFGMSAQFWLNLQLVWDLYHETHSERAPEIRKIRRHPALARKTG